MNGGISLFFCLALLLCFISLSKSDVDVVFDYGVVIDAGSTGNRVIVFRWPRDSPEDKMMQIETVYKEKFKPSLDELEDDEVGLKNIVQTMVDVAKNHVPGNEQSKASIYFFATAGMRLVIEDKANKLFNLIDDWLSDNSVSPFRYERGFGARILSGEEEAAFMLISVNFLLGAFDPGSKKKTTGILELGGASTQIAFEPLGQQILDDKFPLRVMGRRFNLYVHSYLYYGLDYVVMWINDNLQLAGLANPTDNPCMLTGDTATTTNGVTLTGTGNPEACRKILEGMVYKVAPDLCYPKPCSIGTVYEPSIHQEATFYVLGAFFINMKNLGAVGENGRLSLNDIYTKATAYCQRTYDEVITEKPDLKGEYASKTCITGLYIVELFNRGYGIPMDSNQLSTTNNINGQELSWAMGALLYETKFQYKHRYWKMENLLLRRLRQFLMKSITLKSKLDSLLYKS